MANQFFAARGSRVLSEEEFLSHLALASRLENIAVLLGAGASKGVGGQAMSDIWSTFCAEEADSVAWLSEQRFIPEVENPAEEDINVEELLDNLDVAEADLTRRGNDDLRTILRGHRHAMRKYVIRAALLRTDHWAVPSGVIDDGDFGSHIRLIARLIGNRQPGQSAPWVFTTNYDLAVEWSAESLGVHTVNGFNGLHSRTFRPSSFDLSLRNAQARGEARFGTYNIYLGKLHGSLTWESQPDGTVLERPSQHQWELLSDFMESDGQQDWSGLMIFPGAAKFFQTTGFVYGEIIRRFTEFLSRPNACLITCGYSFSDNHINRLIISALQNPTLQVISYVPEVDRYNLYPTLPVPEGEEAIQPNIHLARLLRQQLPQVTVKGSGTAAYFDALARDLPEPALLDEASEQSRQIERLIRGVANLPVTGGNAQQQDNPHGSDTDPPENGEGL